MKNLSVSVHRRLLNLARARNRPFNELFQYFAQGRFLYRLDQSDLADLFVCCQSIFDQSVFIHTKKVVAKNASS